MSELRAATISNLAGTGPVVLTGQTAAKAWCNFNGSGTVAINASNNFSSITDNGVGDFTPNMTSALVDANYSTLFTGGNFIGDTRVVSANASTAKTTSLFRLSTYNAAFAASDGDKISVAVIR